MTNLKAPALIAMVAVFGTVLASAGETKVIANANVKADSISEKELKRVFLEENNSLKDGTHVEPVLEKDGVVHEAFLREYIGKTSEDLQMYYRALAFTGRGSIPKNLATDAEVVAYVARTKGAIGYVSIAASTDGVKILLVGGVSDSADRKLITRIAPEYPETLKVLKIGGTVRLRINIAPKGNVESVELLGGNPILGESAMAAVKQWIYATSSSHSTMDVSIPFDASR
jgi:TonB family protein